ncbi:hypothetical protein [Arthrobacter sedimenti]|uniref:hypothetical protein n=1 Tax=Arthrobacter sedimenti TaxID=2694931 RepID=UPI000B5609CB|nr:hypothetical protein [Arthrobacter sedimenti]OUM45300.1 hypothetical protein B8W73_00910 [Arthrobacter agilis]
MAATEARTPVVERCRDVMVYHHWFRFQGLGERIVGDPLPARHYGRTDNNSMSDTYPTSRSCYAIHYLGRVFDHLLVVVAL